MTQPARARVSRPVGVTPGPQDPGEPAPPPRVRRRLRGNRIVPDPDSPRRRHTVVDPDGRPVTEAAIEQGRRRLRTADDTEWLEVDEWPKVRAVLVCETPSCPAHGREVHAWLAENADGVYRACCGGCGRDITGLFETDDDDPDPS